MAQVAVTIRGRSYSLGCEDGQEDHLCTLAALFDQYGDNLGPGAKNLSEARFLLMAALMMADDFHETRRALADCESTRATEKNKATEKNARGQVETTSQTDDADRSPKVIEDIGAYLQRLDKMAARLDDDEK